MSPVCYSSVKIFVHKETVNLSHCKSLQRCVISMEIFGSNLGHLILTGEKSSMWQKTTILRSMNKIIYFSGLPYLSHRCCENKFHIIQLIPSTEGIIYTDQFMLHGAGTKFLLLQSCIFKILVGIQSSCLGYLAFF